jgi:hypothetical protein
MDRRPRRFLPSTDDLEGRQLMATLTGGALNPLASTTSGAQIDGGGVLEQTIEAKRKHIENLPFFIGLVNKDHVVPEPTVANIQNDLYSLVAILNPANPHDVASFNLDIRKSENDLKISPATSTALNQDFGAALLSTGANASTVADLQTQMAALTAFATTQPQSNLVATNDYAVVLQLALGSGRPLAYPSVPALLSSDHNGNQGKIPITHNAQPTLTGTYVQGVNIQIVNNADTEVLGTGGVDQQTGIYTVKFNDKLANGYYTVRVRVEDSGYVSAPSPKLTIRVDVPPPKPKK